VAPIFTCGLGIRRKRRLIARITAYHVTPLSDSSGNRSATWRRTRKRSHRMSAATSRIVVIQSEFASAIPALPAAP
jgi:hypothetical protein